MKKVLYNIFSIFLAILMLFSTLSFTVEKHHCMGKVVDISFFGNAKSCEMPTSTESGSFEDMHCCVNSVEVVENTNAELKLNTEISFQALQFTVLFFGTYVNLFEGLKERIIPFKDYPPPILIKDIQVLYETYQI